MTGFSVEKDGSMSGGLEDWATSAGKAFGKAKKLFSVVTTGFKDFQNLDEAIRGSGTSFNDYIKYLSRSEDATEAFGLATLYTRARVLLLNMALSTGLALAASLIVKKISEASQSIETNATKSKEAADAAQSTISSLKDLVSAYEELGDKSGWDTEDFDQAKDIQAEILNLAKEQGTLDEDKLGSIDLQNGKYQEQLAILKDITSEQLKASQKELVQSKDAQGTKLVQTAKKNNRSHMFGTIWSNAEMQMGDQIKDAGIDIFNWAGGYGADDINDADSIVDYYNNLGKAIEYIIDNTTDEERAVNGKYHALYQFLMDERNALKDDVDSYTDSISALKQNQFKSDFAEWSANETKKSTQATSEIDAKIKATKEYQDAVKEAQKTEEEWNSQGYGRYGNIDNFHRDKIDWTEENLAKYKDFVDEQNGLFGGIENAQNGIAAATQQMDTISKKIDEIQSAYKACTTAMDEYNKYGYMSTDALQGLLSMSDEYLACLDVVDGKLQINNDRYADLIAAQYTEAEVTAIEQAVNELNALQKEDAKEKTEGLTTATEEQQTALENAIPAFDTLTKAMKEYNQYGYISADTMKSLMGLEDKFTSCLVKNGSKLEINANKFRKLVEQQLAQEAASKKGSKSADELKRILGYLDKNVNSETISFEQLTDAIKGYGTAMDEAKEKTDAIKSAFSGLYDIQQKIKNSQFGVGDLDATESKIESILQLSKFFGDNKDLMDNLVDKNGNINLNTEAFKKATLDELDKRIKAANETGGAAATALANSLSSDKANIESGKISVSDYLVGLGTDLERVNTELDKYQTNWSTLKDAMDEWNTTGQLTQDTMQKLQELPEEFSNLLTYDEDGNATVMEKIFTEFVESMHRLYKNGMVQDKFVENLLEGKKISLDDYLYIVNGKEV